MPDDRRIALLGTGLIVVGMVLLLPVFFSDWELVLWAPDFICIGFFYGLGAIVAGSGFLYVAISKKYKP